VKASASFRPEFIQATVPSIVSPLRRVIATSTRYRRPLSTSVPSQTAPGLERFPVEFITSA